MKTAVLGKGKTGSAVVQYLACHRIAYDIFDRIDPDERIETPPHYDIAVVSPGWVKEHNLIKALQKSGVPIVSEIEFASAKIKKPIIAVSGTNGKTTCCNLISRILDANGLRAPVAGNIGIPLISYVDSQNDYDLIVCEISSFQMEFTERFKPKVSVLLNIAEDHLDRHDSFDEYRSLKLKMVKNQDENDFFITSLDKKIEADFDIVANTLYFSLNKPADVYKIGNRIKMNKLEIATDRLKLAGNHNIENIMAALLTSSLFAKLNKKKTEAALEDFATLEHRLEYVDSVDEVDFVNDSKATNVAAVKSALASFKDKGGKVVLLLGGRYKGGDFSTIFSDIDMIRAIVAFGEARNTIRAQLQSNRLYVVPAINLKGAVYGGFNFAAKGDTVLLSPGCSSFDEFENYKIRGKRFKEIVSEIKRDYDY